MKQDKVVKHPECEEQQLKAGLNLSESNESKTVSHTLISSYID